MVVDSRRERRQQGEVHDVAKNDGQQRLREIYEHWSIRHPESPKGFRALVLVFENQTTRPRFWPAATMQSESGSTLP